MAVHIDHGSITTLFKNAGRPLVFREIVHLMGLGHPEARALKRALRSLVAEGSVVLTRKGRYGISEEMGLVTGYFEAHADGYGFVVSEKPGEKDLFVPPSATLSAMGGDRVVARVEDWRRRKGRVIRVLERAHARVAGTLEVERGLCYVRPKARSVGYDITIPPGERGRAKSKDMVVAEITEYPTAKRPATGRVVKVLDRPEDPKADVASVIEEFGLPVRFPREAHAEAEGLRGKDLGSRKDLTGLLAVTIDGERARDFDDAVSVSKSGKGYRLYVHIADVGHYVPWGSALDMEARRRATSVYFPDRVVPMLPKELSEDLCSLRPSEERPAMTVEMEFDGEGRRTSERFYPSLIKSAERMTYTAVKNILARDERERRRYGRLVAEFELMGELAAILRERRLGRGSLDFDFPEPEVLLDIQGRPEAILEAERNIAHMMIEDFMIAANEAVAEHLSGKGVPMLFRVHEEPEAERVQEVAAQVGMAMRKAEKAGGGAVQRLLAWAKGRPEEEAVTYAVLRTMKRAKYSTENVGHFGLASSCYTHFTSPIRRYPDLVVHRILRESLAVKRLGEGRVAELAGALPDIASRSSRLERVAEEAEVEAVNAMRAWFMKDRVGEAFQARVMGVGPQGLKIRLKDVYVEGFLHVSGLSDDYYQYDAAGAALRGGHTGRAYRIGDEVAVTLDRVDLREREMLFSLSAHGRTSAAAAPPGRTPGRTE